MFRDFKGRELLIGDIVKLFSSATLYSIVKLDINKDLEDAAHLKEVKSDNPKLDIKLTKDLIRVAIASLNDDL
jgi:hypothetical protein